MKIRWILPALISAVILSGCAGQTPSPPPEDALIVVGISQVGAESDWRVANSESMKAVFTESGGYRLLFEDAKQKQENQITAIRKFIQQKVDYIVLLPLRETGWDSVLQEAKDAGIPVIVADRMVDVKDETLFIAHVGSNFRMEGEKAVAWLEDYARSRGKETLNIIHIQGTMGSTAQIGRTAALEQALESHADWTLQVRLDGDFTQAKTYEEVKQYLSEQEVPPEIDVVYCENDNEAFGAIQALEEAGYTCGEGGIAVISFDATRNCLTQCLNGKISLAVECNPLLGPLTAGVIRILEAGGTPEKEHYIEERSFTKETLTEELISARLY